MRLLGASVFSLRITSALIGTLTVLITYQLAREMFAHQGARASRWLALFSAALLATSYWHVTLSRYGFRAISQPLLQTLTLWCLWRGLRRGSRSWLALSGLFFGAIAYTYLASRVFPVVLLLIFLCLLVLDRGNFKRRLSQITVLAGPAIVVFAPLGFYFLTHPQAFSIRISQLSLFNPELNQGDVLGTFCQSARLAFGMIGLRGEPLWRFNVPGKPVFSWPLSLFLLLGLVFSLVKLGWSLYRLWCSDEQFACHREERSDEAISGSLRGGLLRSLRSLAMTRQQHPRARPPKLMCGRDNLERTSHFLLLVWLPVMLLPSILAVKEVPSALRSVGLIPLLFLLPAQGLWKANRWLAGLIPNAISRTALSAITLILLLGLSSIATFRDYFVHWAKAAPVYYDNDGDLVDAARYLNQLDTADAASLTEIFVSSIHYRHPTMAFLARSYDRINWLVGGQTVVFPEGTDKSALYVFPHSARLDETLLKEFFPPDALVQETLGPDGEPAFTAHLFQPDQLPEISPPNPMSVNLGNTLEFLGYEVSRFTHHVLRFTLYWLVLQPTDRDDYSIFVHLLDQWGFRWGEEGFFDYPSAQWAPGDIIINGKEIDVEPGAPPGEYQALVGVYSASLDSRLPRLDEDPSTSSGQGGKVVGTTIALGPAMLSKPEEPPTVESLAIQNPRQEDLGGKIAFLGYDRDGDTARSGESIYLALYWQARQDLDEDYNVVIGLRGAGGPSTSSGRGDVWVLWADRPVHGTYPTTNWTAGEIIKDRYGLTIGQDVPDGDYELELMLLHRVTQEPLAATSGLPTISLGRLRVEAWERQFVVPAIQHPLEVNLGNKVELLGYDLDRTLAKPGDSLHLILHWRGLKAMEESYTVFTHLLDGESRIWGQKDNVPQAGAYPTTLWAEGEVVVDEYEIIVKPDAPPGQYVIEVGMYLPQSGERLPVLDELGQVQGDRILLGVIEIQFRE